MKQVFQLRVYLETPKIILLSARTCVVGGWISSSSRVDEVTCMITGTGWRTAQIGLPRGDVEKRPGDFVTGFRADIPSGDLRHLPVGATELTLQITFADGETLLLTDHPLVYRSAGSALDTAGPRKLGNANFLLGVATAALAAGELSPCSDAIRLALIKAPDNRLVLLRNMQLKKALQDWAGLSGAVAAYLEHFAASAETRSAELLLNAMRDEQLAVADQRRLQSMSPAELFGRFESLGFNCEFGIAQRAFGCETLGLLRFASVPARSLLAVLRNRFDGVGDPENTKLAVEGKWGGEYGISDVRFGFESHTYIYHSPNDDHAALFDKQCKRLKFLKDKLLNDLEAGEKIFVYYNYDDVPLGEIRLIAEALQTFGKNHLLFVRLATDHHPLGSIVADREGLFIGHIDKFSTEAEVATKISFPSWYRLCRAAFVSICPDSAALLHRRQ
jgi:hypothetical protein